MSQQSMAIWRTFGSDAQDCTFQLFQYRRVNKGLYVLLSRTQAEPGRIVEQEQEKISRNHVQTYSGFSVHDPTTGDVLVFPTGYERPGPAIIPNFNSPASDQMMTEGGRSGAQRHATPSAVLPTVPLHLFLRTLGRSRSPKIWNLE